VRNIVIHPTELDFQNKTVQVVTFQRLYEGAKTHKTYYQPQTLCRARSVRADDGKPVVFRRVGDSLKAVAQQTKRRSVFVIGWESERPTAISLWTVGTVAVVGGVWPTCSGSWSAPASHGARKKKEEDYFDRFSHAPEAAKATAPATWSATRSAAASTT
jgi:hypothetical protein